MEKSAELKTDLIETSDTLFSSPQKQEVKNNNKLKIITFFNIIFNL
jgi:hypothetical protein